MLILTSGIFRGQSARSSMSSLLRRLPKTRERKGRKTQEKTPSCSSSSPRVPAIAHSELRPMRNFPSFLMASSTTMTSKLWNLTRVTVRQEVGVSLSGLLDKELASLCRITHPHILLLMAYCPASEEQGLQLVFEHVSLGSLHQWLHKQERPPSLKTTADILIQVCQAAQQCKMIYNLRNAKA